MIYILLCCLTVAVRLRRTNEEHDTVYFDVPHLRRAHHHRGRRFVLHVTDLQMSFNTLQLYVDCADMGKDFTPFSLREVIGGNQTIVSKTFAFASFHIGFPCNMHVVRQVERCTRYDDVIHGIFVFCTNLSPTSLKLMRLFYSSIPFNKKL